MFVVVAVTILIVAGISHAGFVKEHPDTAPVYPKQTIAAFNRRFPFLIAVPTAIVLIGVIWTVGIEFFAVPADFTTERWEALMVSVFLLLITVATPVYVYAGMQKSKYDKADCLRENVQAEAGGRERRRTDWGGIIMLAATAVFLLLGVCWNLWKYSWAAFPVGGILCAIVSIAAQKEA